MNLLLPLVEAYFPLCCILAQLILMKEVQNVLACLDVLILGELRLRRLRLFLNFLKKVLRHVVALYLLFVEEVLQHFHQLVANRRQ